MANQSQPFRRLERAGERSPGAPPKALSARERILETARDSFYREGIRAVGVDTLIARSGVAKMSFYRSFRSKDELVCAYLESSAAEYWQWWDEVIRAHAHAPRKQLRALFVGDRGPRHLGGFPRMPVRQHAGRVPRGAAIRRARSSSSSRPSATPGLRELAKAAGARDPERLADQLGIVLEGSGFCAEAARPVGPRISAGARGGNFDRRGDPA